MARPRFSEMLVDRRRQLGLSVTQASNVLRLKEQVLIAFEEGDFENMPKSGYAQGMLSSYARYLGLNPQEVTRQFSRDLYDYERARGGRPAPANGSMTARERRQREYQGARGLLPTSGGYAGDMADYATTSQPRTRQQASSPLVNARAQDRAGERPSDAGRRYTARYVPMEGTQSRASQQRAQRERQRVGARAVRDEENRPARRNADRVTTRRVTSSEYVDDMRYGEANPYRAASTREGRASSRNIASTERPRVQRRGGTSREQLRERGRRQQPRHTGVRGAVESVLGDQQRVMILLVLVVVLVLTVVIILSVQSCVRAPAEGASRTVAVSTESSQGTSSDSGSGSDSGSDSSASSTSSEEASQAAAEAAAAKARKDQEDQSTETDVKVSVADGEVSWVEVTCDGTSEVAEQVTGPWSKSYVVTESISIQVDNTSAVTVTKNGAQQSFESKSSGIGTITIQGTKVSSSASSDSDDGSSSDSEDSSGSSSGKSTGSDSSGSGSGSSTKKTTSSGSNG